MMFLASPVKFILFRLSANFFIYYTKPFSLSPNSPCSP